MAICKNVLTEISEFIVEYEQAYYKNYTLPDCPKYKLNMYCLSQMIFGFEDTRKRLVKNITRTKFNLKRPCIYHI